jgi:Fe-S cluster assembly iron-binding protein IscA
MKEGGGVLTVTALAVEKLKEAIRTQTTDPEVGIRLMPSPSKPNQFEMALDKKKEGDQVVESEGLKILLFRPELAPALKGMVINCQETPHGVRFTMSKPTPGT